jgi:hypothetical protein
MKAIRREILVALRQCQTDRSAGWLSVRSLTATLNFGGGDRTQREIVDACRYLASAGYIDDESKRGVVFEPSNASFRIAAKGISLLDEVAEPDPNIEDQRLV